MKKRDECTDPIRSPLPTSPTASVDLQRARIAVTPTHVSGDTSFRVKTATIGSVRPHSGRYRSTPCHANRGRRSRHSTGTEVRAVPGDRPRSARYARSDRTSILSGPMESMHHTSDSATPIRVLRFLCFHTSPAWYGNYGLVFPRGRDPHREMPLRAAEVRGDRALFDPSSYSSLAAFSYLNPRPVNEF